MLRPELLLDLIRGQACVCSVQLCTAAQCCLTPGPPHPRSRASAGGDSGPPRLEGEQGWQARPLLTVLLLLAKQESKVAGRLCAGAVGWGALRAWLGDTNLPRSSRCRLALKDVAEAETPGSWVLQGRGVLLGVPSALGSGKDTLGSGEAGGIHLGLGRAGGFQNSWSKTKGQASDDRALTDHTRPYSPPHLPHTRPRP